MKIRSIVNQHRRDFTAVYECEHCGHTHEGIGYDDEHFHRNVIPAKQCPECGKTSDPDTYRPMGTKYAEDQII